MKIKDGVDPIGKKVLVKTQISGTVTWHEYKVHTVTGNHANIPNPDGPIIHMEINERRGIDCDQYVTLPLSAFRTLCRPSGEAFWQDEKTVNA